MRKLIILVLLVGLSFAQKPTTRPIENTDWIHIMDTNQQGWDYTKLQLFNAPFTMTNLYRTGGFSINIVDTFTQILAAAHKSIKVDLTYSPMSGGVAAAGTAAPIAIVGKVNLSGNLTAANSYAGMGWGVQGQIHIVDGSTIDGSTYGAPGAVYAGLRGVVTDGSGNSTYTKGILAAVYAEIQMNQSSAENNPNFDIYGIYIRNQGVTTSPDLTAGLYMDANIVQGGANFEIGIDINDAVVGMEIDATTTGIDFQGAYTNAAIDFSDVTLDHTSSSGPVFIRAGTYGAPVTSSDPHQSGMIRLYGSNSATTDAGSGFYDRIIFANHQITGNKGGIAIAGLVEVRDVGAEAGPVNVKAAEFIVHLSDTGSKLATSAGDPTHGMYAAWFKIAAKDGATTHANSKKAPIWLDNSMYGINALPGEEYSIYATAGNKVDAFVGFETGDGAGWSSLFYFDETAYDEEPVFSGDIDDGSSDYYLRVNLNGALYGIPLYAL